MKAYSVISKYYDLAMGDRSKVTNRIEKYIQEYVPSATSVLDLATGTGAVTAPLSSKYKVVGVDNSREMLDIAKKQYPSIRYLQEDICELSLGQKFDVVLCLFDSINHLNNKSEWGKLFQVAKQHLNDGGVFIFDLNTVEKLDYISNQNPHVRSVEGDYLITSVSKDSTYYFWQLQIFRKIIGSIYIRNVDCIKEQSYSLEYIAEELKKVFKEIKHDVSSTLPDGSPARVYFLCMN